MEFANPDFIVIDLNVWKCSNTSQIIEILFNVLKEKLKRYSLNIGSEIQNYIDTLLKGTTNENFNRVKNLTEMFFSNPSIEKQYDSINKEIKKINKKIIILIDDIDRLDKHEIYEVLRLIRNTANFSNTFFIVAYDRNYILNAIEDINSYQSHVFLEKIFQVEFILPPIKDKVLQDAITNEFDGFLSSESKKAYQEILDADLLPFNQTKINLGSQFVFNLRDVIRFVNSLKLSYEFVKEEICFHDFYNLEFIRFKHPEIFAQVYKNSATFFTTEATRNNNIIDAYSYSLSLIKDENLIDTRIFRLEEYLKNHRTVYKLSNADILSIVSAYNALFPRPNGISQGANKVMNSHLSVTRPSMYDRYFILGIEGKLSEIHFSKIRQLPFSEFSSEIAELAKNEDLLIEISERFQEIKDFDNKDDFEKIIKTIFYFANLPHPDKIKNYGFDSIRYEGQKLAELLGGKKVLKFYNSTDDYKNFLNKLFITNNNHYTYTNEFVSSLLHENYYYIQTIMVQEEISEILLTNFINALNKSDKLSIGLWHHYLRCEERREVQNVDYTYTVSYTIIEAAKPLLRKFILEKDIDNFIRITIRQDSPFNETYFLNSNIQNLFNRDEIFIWLLRRSHKPSKYKEEFLCSYDLLTTNNEHKQAGVPLSFFKVIPVKEPFTE